MKTPEILKSAAMAFAVYASPMISDATLGTSMAIAEATPADQKLAGDSYAQILDIVRRPVMVDIAEKGLRIYADPSYRQYFHALNSIRNGRVANNIGGKGVLAYCASVHTNNIINQIIPTVQNHGIRQELNDIQQEAGTIARDINNRLYEGKAHHSNCPQVYQTYTH